MVRGVWLAAAVAFFAAAFALLRRLRSVDDDDALEDFLAARQDAILRCKRNPTAARAIEENGFAQLFAGIEKHHQGVRVLSTDPFVVYFDELLKDEQIVRLLSVSSSLEFEKSLVGIGASDPARRLRASSSAKCMPGLPVCSADAVLLLYQSISRLTGISVDHFEVRYARCRAISYRSHL